jgi:hypothetical protein
MTPPSSIPPGRAAATPNRHKIRSRQPATGLQAVLKGVKRAAALERQQQGRSGRTLITALVGLQVSPCRGSRLRSSPGARPARWTADPVATSALQAARCRSERRRAPRRAFESCGSPDGPVTPSLHSSNRATPTRRSRRRAGRRRDAAPQLAKRRAQAFAARGPLAESKQGGGRTRGAGSAYPRQRKSRASGATMTTAFIPPRSSAPQVATRREHACDGFAPCSCLPAGIRRLTSAGSGSGGKKKRVKRAHRGPHVVLSERLAAPVETLAFGLSEQDAATRPALALAVLLGKGRAPCVMPRLPASKRWGRRPVSVLF